MNTKNESIIIVDDQDETNTLYDINERIYQLRDETSLDLISRNIIDHFNEPVNYETQNYVSRFKETYTSLKEAEIFDGDIDILNNALQELSQLVVLNLNNKFYVGLGDNLDDGLVIDIDEYLTNIETLYNFFVVRRYTNIKDYFKARLMQNKIKFVEKYKMALDDREYDDLFLAQDKKKFRDVSDAIIIHFINDIIDDIKSEISSAYDFFKDIVNLDLFEEYNNRMNELLQNYGNEFLVLDDHKAIDAYLSLLNIDELRVSLRNDLLSIYLIDAPLSEK